MIHQILLALLFNGDIVGEEFVFVFDLERVEGQIKRTIDKIGASKL